MDSQCLGGMSACDGWVLGLGNAIKSVCVTMKIEQKLIGLPLKFCVIIHSRVRFFFNAFKIAVGNI